MVLCLLGVPLERPSSMGVGFACHVLVGVAVRSVGLIRVALCGRLRFSSSCPFALPAGRSAIVRSGEAFPTARRFDDAQVLERVPVPDLDALVPFVPLRDTVVVRCEIVARELCQDAIEGLFDRVNLGEVEVRDDGQPVSDFWGFAAAVGGWSSGVDELENRVYEDWRLLWVVEEERRRTERRRDEGSEPGQERSERRQRQDSRRIRTHLDECFEERVLHSSGLCAPESELVESQRWEKSTGTPPPTRAVERRGLIRLREAYNSLASCLGYSDQPRAAP